MKLEGRDLRGLLMTVACALMLACSSTDDAGGRGGGGGDGDGTGGNAFDNGDGDSAGFDNGDGDGSSGGTGAIGGDGDGSGTGGIEGCADVDVQPKATFSPGNLLVVFDRSISMDSDFDGRSRLVAAGEGLINALLPFTCAAAANPDGTPCTDNLTVAALLFPSHGFLSCDPIHPLTDPTQINWMKSTDFVNAWNAYWMANTTITGTPITPAFAQAATELTSAQGMLEGNFAVLFMTDGAGTCDAGAGAVPQAQMWAAAGIPTYVVNLDNGAGGGGLGGNAAFNDMVAAAGGTGAGINPSDQAALDAALQMVLQATAKVESCDLTLKGEITDVDAACAGGTVILGTRTLECSDTDGYTIPSPNKIVLTGPACDDLMNGGYLNATFPCAAVVPQ